MTSYTHKPLTVEAMQWLGPDDPAHVAEFEAWVKGCEPNAMLLGRLVSNQGDIARLFDSWFVVFIDGWFDSMPPDYFHDRYTPTPDAEGE